MMEGLTWASLKRRPSLIPLFAFTILGVGGGLSYLARCALLSPDVSWNRKGNPEPWEEYRNKQYKLYSPDKTTSAPVCPAPEY